MTNVDSARQHHQQQSWMLSSTPIAVLLLLCGMITPEAVGALAVPTVAMLKQQSQTKDSSQTGKVHHPMIPSNEESYSPGRAVLPAVYLQRSSAAYRRPLLLDNQMRQAYHINTGDYDNMMGYNGDGGLDQPRIAVDESGDMVLYQHPRTHPAMEEDQEQQKRSRIPPGWDKRAQTFVRFGKRAQTFVRFGKRAQTFVRFG